jgi:hypothetical protein
VSAKGVFGITKRRFPPESAEGQHETFRRQIATLAMQVFEIGLLERFGVVTSLCWLELQSPLARRPLARRSLLTDRTSRTATFRREIGGLEISGTSAGLRGNFLDDSW